MSESGSSGFDREEHTDPFDTTHWSVVLSAGGDSTAESKRALSTLCQKYWGPLYAYVRRRGYSVHDAQDLTQGFFADFLERGSLSDACPERGKFRAYLLTALKHYMANDRRRESAQKRGGGDVPLSLDFDTAEGYWQLQPVDALTPEAIFERQWAMTLLDAVLARLGETYAATGKDAVFEKLSPCLTGDDGTTPYRTLAGELGMTEGAVKVAVHRLRARFASLLRDEITQTVARPEDIELEIRDLFSALG